MTDWDAELKKIDKQLESISDSALIPAPKPGALPPAGAGAAPRGVAPSVAAERAQTRTWGAFLRLALATALGVGILFWPYQTRCGAGLAGYMVAVAAVTVGGLWSSVWTWKHRTARAHVLSLLLVVWGLVLAAVEVLPRSGYAKADASRPTGWGCVATTEQKPAFPLTGKP